MALQRNGNVDYNLDVTIKSCGRDSHPHHLTERTQRMVAVRLALERCLCTDDDFSAAALLRLVAAFRTQPRNVGYHSTYASVSYHCLCVPPLRLHSTLQALHSITACTVAL